MGCTTSKLDDLPAVALCRERCAFLDEAIHQRYAFADAHLAYLHSLRRVGHSLHSFFDLGLDNPSAAAAAAPPSPVLNLPAQRKGDAETSNSPPAAVVHRHSDSGSHLHFQSDSEDEDSASESLHHHSGDSSPLHSYGQVNYTDHESYNPGGFMNINYMKNEATPSVVSYEQRPVSSETVRMGDSSMYYPYAYANQDPSPYPYYGHPNYGGAVNNLFGSPPVYGSSFAPPSVAASSASSSKPPPPPPSPPRASAWEFLNLFESSEKYYPSYTPSRNSREVREEEGIPDLEDEDYHHEVVKEVHGDQTFMDGGSADKSYAEEVAEEEDVNRSDAEGHYQTRPSVSMENDNVVYEVHVVDKKVVDNEEKEGDGGSVPTSKARAGFKDDSEVVRETQAQFEKASESGSEFATMLEVGKLPYHRKNAIYQASSKLLHVITPLSVVTAQPHKSADSSSSIDEADPAVVDVGEDMAMRSKSLSSTLQKIYLWEKKLYEEIKVEEKMRLDHEKRRRRLKHLDERGAEAHKVDATRALVRSLSTKIRIAIQVVDKISVKINKLRDEELWPQLHEFIKGLTRMWKSMLESHQSQCHAIGEAKRLDAIISRKHLSDAHLEAALELEHDLLDWTLKFSCWIGAQKGYVRALNNWLLKCLLYIPEETPDGVVPFSPGRIGAPPVFVICNQWAQALERISEKEVVDSMRDFAMNVLQLWEQNKLEMHQKMMVNKDMERKDQKIQKQIQVLEKQIVLVSRDGNGLSVGGQVVYQSDTSKNGSLHGNLLHIFEAMERFTADSLKVYEELLQRITEDGLA